MKETSVEFKPIKWFVSPVAAQFLSGQQKPIETACYHTLTYCLHLPTLLLCVGFWEASCDDTSFEYGKTLHPTLETCASQLQCSPLKISEDWSPRCLDASNEVKVRRHRVKEDTTKSWQCASWCVPSAIQAGSRLRWVVQQSLPFPMTHTSQGIAFLREGTSYESRRGRYRGVVWG